MVLKWSNCEVNHIVPYSLRVWFPAFWTTGLDASFISIKWIRKKEGPLDDIREGRHGDASKLMCDRSLFK